MKVTSIYQRHFETNIEKNIFFNISNQYEDMQCICKAIKKIFNH
jgi:hypothetical protein